MPKKIAGMSTTEIVALGGVGLLAVYFLTKKTTTTVPVVTVPAVTTTTTSSNSTTAYVDDASDVIDDLTSLFN